MVLELKLTCSCGLWMMFIANSTRDAIVNITRLMEHHDHFGDVFTLRCTGCGREFRGGPQIFPGNGQRGALETARWLIQHDHRVPARVQ